MHKVANDFKLNFHSKVFSTAGYLADIGDLFFDMTKCLLFLGFKKALRMRDIFW